MMISDDGSSTRQIHQMSPDLLLPSKGTLEACNQVIIFSPMLLLLWVRRQPLSSAWIQTQRVWARLLVGMLLAALAILVFTTVRAGSANWFEVVPKVYQPGNLPLAVQVWLEDVAIAILYVRLRAAMGTPLSVVLVAVLFAGGHIPALISDGVALADLSSVILDAGLVVAVIAVLQRSGDIWWIWCVHFAMDMMQYYSD